MSLFLPAPGKPPALYSAEEQGQYRLAIHQVLRRVAEVLGVTSLAVVTVTADYQVKPTDGVVRLETTNGAVTATLPPSASVKGQVVWVKKATSDAHTATIRGNGTELIDGSATLAWTTALLGHAVFANGTGWDVLV